MKHSAVLHKNSKILRKNMTPEERHLWYDFLSKSGMNARRQKVSYNYILDFYIPGAKIAIELAGVQHNKEEHYYADKERDAFLESNGIMVLRYTNVQVNDNFSSVYKDIQKHYNERIKKQKIKRKRK